MSHNFHERFERSELALPPDRSTGLVFAAVAVVLAYVWRANAAILLIAGSLTIILTAISLLQPTLLRPLNIGWMCLAQLLSRIVNPIVMLILFALVIVPAGLLMRLNYDPMRSRRSSGSKSYWITCEPVERSDMRQQF